jgi:hypothetical protein
MHLFFAIGPAIGHALSIVVICWRGKEGGGSLSGVSRLPSA